VWTPALIGCRSIAGTFAMPSNGEHMTRLLAAATLLVISTSASAQTIREVGNNITRAKVFQRSAIANRKNAHESPEGINLLTNEV
jgi:hypothetical protein